MRHTSLKRAAQLVQYVKERREFLKAKPLCQVCYKRRSFDVHHKGGREGRLLLDQNRWLAVCRTCHDKIHQEPAWAKANGYRT